MFPDITQSRDFSPSPVTSVTSASMSFYCLPRAGSPQLLLFCGHLPSWRTHPSSGSSWSTYPVSHSLRSTPRLPLPYITALFKSPSTSRVEKRELLRGSETFAPWSVHGSLHPLDKCEVTLLLMGFPWHGFFTSAAFSRERLGPHDKSFTQSTGDVVQWSPRVLNS